MASKEEKMAALKKLAAGLGMPTVKEVLGIKAGPVQKKARGGMAKKMMRGGSVQPKRMRGGGMAKMASKKKMMRGGAVKKK